MTLYFIGTIHGGFTPSEELVKEIELLQPDVLLVEMTQQDIEDHNINHYPPEMIAAYQWARDSELSVFGFDAAIWSGNEDLDPYESERIVKKQIGILKQYSWKEMNQNNYMNKLNSVSGSEKQINPVKQQERRERMITHIRGVIDQHSDPHVVVITGAGHLDYFEKQFPDAVLPLRNV